MNTTENETLIKFIEEYNLLFNVPAEKATMLICEKYESEHPNEFKSSDWSIEKHRKRFMDWMSRQRSEGSGLLYK